MEILLPSETLVATFKHKEDEDGSTALLIPGYKKLDRDQVKWCKPQDDDHEDADEFKMFVRSNP